MVGINVRRRTAWLPVALLLVAVGWGSNQITPLLVVYQRALPASTGTIEAMFAVYALGLIPGLLVAGPISDARGRRVVVIPAAVLSLVATLALVAGERTLWLLFVGRLLAGVSSGGAFGAGTAWVRELSRPPHGDVSEHVAARRAAVAMTLGFALGPLVAGFLAQWAPKSLLVPYMPHVLLIVTVLLVIGVCPETVTHGPRPAKTREIAQSKPVRLPKAVMVMAPWVFMAPAIAFALLPSVVGAQRAGTAPRSWLPSPRFVPWLGFSCQPLARRLDTETQDGRAATFGLVVLVAGLALAAFTAASHILWMLFPCAVVLGAAYGMCLVAGLVEVQRAATPEKLAQLAAIFYAPTYTGFAAPYLLAIVSHLAGYPILLSVTAGLALLTALGVRVSTSDHRAGLIVDC